MHRAAVSLAIVLASTVLAAQTAGQNQPQIEIHTTVTGYGSAGSSDLAAPAAREAQVRQAIADVMANACPVSLHARQSSAAFAREVHGTPPQGVAQRLHVTVTNPDSKHVVAANVTVRGFADKARVVETMTSQDSGDAAKNLDVRFPDGPGKEVSSDLRVPGLTGVTVIDLNSVTYSDGSTWKLSAGSSCRTWIDGLMFVSNR